MRRINLHGPRLVSLALIIGGLIAVTTGATANLAARSDSSSQSTSRSDSALTTALVQQDWSTVAAILDSDASSAPAMQFIQAHAFTALNQPNESLCAILEASSDENVAAWRAWTQDFQARYPQHAVGYYLLGDAQARSGDVTGAITTFTVGLEAGSERSAPLERPWDRLRDSG